MQKINNVRGFFGIGIYNPKFEENIGTLWRHAYLYNASFIFTIGGKYKQQSSDTMKTPNHVPLYHHDTWEDFKAQRPIGSRLVAIEMDSDAECLSTFQHPLNAIYILGSEANGLPRKVIDDCNDTVQIFSLKPQSMNVSSTGTIVMYDRIIKIRGEND